MDQITFKYKYDPNYNPVFSNGVYGGMTPRGEIVMNFFTERPALPKEETYQIIGNMLSPIPNSPKPENLHQSAVRFIECGVIIDEVTAKSIIDWLQHKIDTIQAMRLKKEVPNASAT